MSDETVNTATTQDTEANKSGDDNTVTEGTARHNKALLDDLVKSKGRVTALENEKANFDKELTARDNRIAALITDNAIRDVIGGYDVKPALRSALINHLKNMIVLDDEVATFGGKSADDFGKDYFASEEGREWLKPVMNSGGGATGNTGTTPQTPDVWNLSKYADMKVEDPAMAAAYAKKHNKNF